MGIISLTVFLRTEMKTGQIPDAAKFWGALFFSLINVMFNGVAEISMTVFRLPVFFKQRDSLFFPAWAFALPIAVLRVQISLVESAIWILLTYYTIGFAPAASRFFKQLLAFCGIHQVAVSLFRFIGGLGRTQVVTNTLGSLTLLLVFVLGGYIVAKDDIKNYMIWGYYVSPMMYGQNAVAINEFLSERWSTPMPNGSAQPTVGKTLLKEMALFVDEYWYWISIGALFGFSVLFNILFIVALTYLNRSAIAVRNGQGNGDSNRGMVLPFQPLSLAFNHDNYYVDMPAEMKTEGVDETRLQLLRDISGAFRPGILTALVGYSAWLRLAVDIKTDTRKMFVEEVMDLVELNPLRNALVGLRGVDGLSTEQRKRLTIAVELVANPSWMSPHLLLLMKRGGRVIYAGSLGRQSHKLVEYFEAIPGVPKIKDGYNPATWMLEVNSAAAEVQLNVDFAEIYANSDLCRHNQELIKELSTPAPNSKDLYFPTQYSQSFLTQCKATFWKQHWSYWRNSQYNAIRIFMTIVIGVMFGVIFWGKGDQLTVFYRERAAGMYSELPYAFSQVAIETVYVAVQTLAYSLLLFSMIGYQWKVDKFLYFYYFVFMCFAYFSMYGMMIVALTPGHQIASIVMSFFLNFWNLFSGFLVPRPLIPVWWRWYYWGSPVAWTIYGVFASQIADINTELTTSNGTIIRVDLFLKENFGYEHDFLVSVVLAHLGWVLLFFFVFAYGIKFLNFQRR
ncbi:hypothetical protein RJ639_026085 [Escallonia herrerae]|uniref:ABC transporter n=1 Tax=Escallonia herrerae TaxID=1293975 RepID=A0AA88S2U5_9ASTE|nr:hypothetical protein RJ639_026085 [Escallonia herrerae]